MDVTSSDISAGTGPTMFNSFNAFRSIFLNMTTLPSVLRRDHDTKESFIQRLIDDF